MKMLSSFPLVLLLLFFSGTSSSAEAPESGGCITCQDSMHLAASVRVFESRVRKYQRKIARSKPGSDEQKVYQQRLNYNLGKLRAEYELKLNSASLSNEKRRLYIERRKNLIEYMETRAESRRKAREEAKKKNEASLQYSKPTIENNLTSSIPQTQSEIKSTQVQ